MNRKISELTQANLRQQMNPHFIFNTLNSIQYYMYQHDKLTTNMYLTKFSSSIALTDNDLKAKPHNEQWIKDEMERRLWLCDKWFVRVESDRSRLSSTLKTIADHMAVFLNYRDKYYGISSKDDGLALMGYLDAKNEAGIRIRLTEYKNWWNVNKARSINLL